MRSIWRRARAFADGPLRLALAAGARLDDGTKRRVAERYAELTGLDADYVFASDLRVLDTRFRKRLLLDRSRIVGRYDGRAAGYDLDPVSDDETFVVDDAYLDPAYSSLVNAYLRDELGWGPRPRAPRFCGFRLGIHRAGQGVDVVAPPARATPSALRARSSRSRRSRPTWPWRSCTSPRSRC